MSAAAATRGMLGIGDVLGLLRSDFPDITISKIRFLETEGLVEPARTASGYRKFAPADLERLRYVLSCQRDHYLPLKVIREHLDAIDRGLEPPAIGANTGPRAPRSLVAVDAGPSAESFRAAAGDVRLSRAELIEETAVSEEILDQLESFGIVAPVPGGQSANRFYGGESLAIVRTVGEMSAFGIEPRHLRQFKVAADREIGLVEQVVTPMVRQRDPESRQRADDAIRELAALSVRLHASLVKAGLARELGR
jgi:DNA-binding transcriptional MerR regulator